MADPINVEKSCYDVNNNCAKKKNTYVLYQRNYGHYLQGYEIAV